MRTIAKSVQVATTATYDRRRVRTARRFRPISVAVAVGAGAVLSGCGGLGTPVPYRNISAQLQGYQPPRLAREVFKSRTELAKYLRRTVPSGNVRVPPVNWTRREAILVDVHWDHLHGRQRRRLCGRRLALSAKHPISAVQQMLGAAFADSGRGAGDQNDLVGYRRHWEWHLS